MKIYSYKQEVWSEKECEKRSKRAPSDSFGNRPPRGIIASSASVRAEYGQTVRFNGGTVIGQEWYSAEYRPLPKISPDYEFHNLSGWGLTIRKKLNPTDPRI